MSPVRNRIIAIASKEVGSRGGTKYGKDGLWCGAFVVWCLREAGLNVETGHEYPGENLCSGLPLTNSPEPGDIVRYRNDHCAIVLSCHDGALYTVDGSHTNEVVSAAGRRVSHSMTFYSVDELIRCYEMTGAQTGEVA